MKITLNGMMVPQKWILPRVVVHHLCPNIFGNQYVNAANVPMIAIGKNVVVEVGEHEVRVVEVDVRSARAQEDPGHAADQELGHEGQRPMHRRGEGESSPRTRWR